MAHPSIQIVDEQDQPIGEASMSEAQEKGLYHRIVRVMVFDQDGRVLLQKRSPQMVLFPNAWAESASGHVDAGESYKAAAAREAEEEIGLKDIELEEIGYWESHDQSSNGRTMYRFNRAYKVTVDNPQLSLQPEEVAEVRWLTLDEAKKLVAEQPENSTNGLRKILADYF